MIRSTRHILKYQTRTKTNYLDQLWSDYEQDLKYYIDLILEDELPLKLNLTSKELPFNIIKHSQWKQVIYKSASEIIRSQIKQANQRRYKLYKFLYSKCRRTNRHKNFTNKRFKDLNLKPIIQTKYFTKPKIKNFSINIDQRLFDLDQSSKEFDEFIMLKTPLPLENDSKHFLRMNLPIRYHKHALKYLKDQTWSRKNTIKLTKVNNQYHFDLIYQKESPPTKPSGNPIGIDIGYSKLAACSDGKVIGQELKDQYKKISNKKQGSKSFKRALTERTNLTNQILNKLNLDSINHIVVEDLTNLNKSRSKFNHKFNNKLQRWVYRQVLTKLERLSEENGILFTKVDPSYTSQTCSACGKIDKNARKGEVYHCSHCGLFIDADLNASINISRRGVYNLSRAKKIKPVEPRLTDQCDQLTGFNRSG